MRAPGRTLALGIGVLLLAAGCGSGHSADTGLAGSNGIRLYGTDGNMSNSFGADFQAAGAIEGMVGTTPLTPLSEDFQDRLAAVNPKLGDDNYAGESYDAVVISALAVQMAHSTDARVVSQFVGSVVDMAPGDRDCTVVKDCLADIAQGKGIVYRGIAVQNGFTTAGEPATASYGTLHFGANNQIDSGKTEFVSAGAPSAETGHTPSDTGDSPGPLKLGFLLPKTGAVAQLGPPMFAGAHLAVKEINAAGGVLGKPVQAVDGDDASTDVAKATAGFNSFVSQGIPIIIGPATSGESAALIPKAIAAGRMLFSPSATSATLSTVDDQGLFFRSCPADSYQAQALSNVIMRGGAQRVFIVARDDSYGTGLRDAVSKDLGVAGIKPNELATKTYSDDDKDYSPILTAIKAFKPDAVLVAGYDESAKVIEALQAGGVDFSHSATG